MFELIKKDLPNFPDEVILDWIMHHSKDIGWPLSSENWDNIFFGKDINFWKKTIWNKERLNLNTLFYCSKTNKHIKEMCDAYVNKETNIFSETENISNGQSRFNRSLDFLCKNGYFPKPICLLKLENIFTIVDGNHRASAFKYYEFISNRGTLKVKNFSPIQEVWVASIHP